MASARDDGFSTYAAEVHAQIVKLLVGPSKH
jgi:hypothetical protein